MGECGELSDVPHRFNPDDEASRLWAQDRIAFRDCKRLNHAKGDAIRALVE